MIFVIRTYTNKQRCYWGRFHVHKCFRNGRTGETVSLHQNVALGLAQIGDDGLGATSFRREENLNVGGLCRNRQK